MAVAAVALFGLLAAGAVSFAGEAAPAAPAPPAGGPGQGFGLGPCGIPPWIELNKEQQAKLDEIRKQAMEELRTKIRSVLTPEQQKEYDAFRLVADKMRQTRQDQGVTGQASGGPGRGFGPGRGPGGMGRGGRGPCGMGCPMGGPGMGRGFGPGRGPGGGQPPMGPPPPPAEK
jgi:Spy/CpxP family protein refolding chaperone